MYSHGNRPGASSAMANRYMKGRLPDGVDFAAYPGRSSTPLPTAESKSAERINQLKIWNEAATNDDKRRLAAANKLGPVAGRRTDSFKDAKDRHSASFIGVPPTDAVRTGPIRRPGVPLAADGDMFADRSESESEEEEEQDVVMPVHTHVPQREVVMKPMLEPSAKMNDVLSPVAAPIAQQPNNYARYESQPSQADRSSQHQLEPKESRACCVIM